MNLCDKNIWKYTFQFCPRPTMTPQWDLQPTLAVDGDTTTFVTSGKAQDGTFFALIDLHGAANVSSFVLDYGTGTNEGDISASPVVLQASDDGVAFTNIAGAVTGLLTAHKVTVSVPSGVTHRYLKLLQQGTSNSWWAVPEVNLTCTTNGTKTAPPADAVTTRPNWKILTPNAACNTDLPKMLDSMSGTQWQSGGKPGVGYWIRVDLGAATLINNVDLKSSGTDFPATLKLQLSTDDVTYTDVKTGVVGAVDTKIVLDTPQTARFFRVVSQTDSAGTAWWSVNELDINVP